MFYAGILWYFVESQNLKNLSNPNGLEGSENATTPQIQDLTETTTEPSEETATMGDVVCNGHESQDRNMNPSGDATSTSPTPGAEGEMEQGGTDEGVSTESPPTSASNPEDLASPTSPTSPNPGPTDTAMEAENDLKSQDGSEGTLKSVTKYSCVVNDWS